MEKLIMGGLSNGCDHYQEVADLISILKNSGQEHYGKLLQSAMDDGATGTEIFMALRWHLNQLLSEPIENDVINAKALRLVKELDKALS